MAQHQLLIFPEPARAERAPRRGGGGKVRFPETRRQAERLAPQFQRLQRAMDRQRLALQNNALGLQPEQVLVLETIGPIPVSYTHLRAHETDSYLVCRL